MDKKSILFICTKNSARSQMAEALVNSLYGDGWKAFSGGTEPGSVNPFAVEAMKEVKIDISHHRSKSINEFRGWHFNVVVTVCSAAAEACPFFPGDRVVHHPFPDPASVGGTDEERLEAFRRSRDDLKRWLQMSLPSWQ